MDVDVCADVCRCVCRHVCRNVCRNVCRYVYSALDLLLLATPTLPYDVGERNGMRGTEVLKVQKSL